mgnify:FL=1
MKALTRHLLGLLSTLAALALLVVLAPAALAEEYTYSVTLSAGRQGTVTGGGVTVEGSTYTQTSDGTTIKLSGLHKGARVTFQAGDAARLNDDTKYYISGIRLSGRDNNTRAADPSFLVDGDADYVVAYGIRGDMVEYTVQYQDEDGNALADSRTYYGNVGDEAVVAYLYVEGYRPLNFNLSKVLSANGADNVFTFVYTQILEDEVIIVDGGTTVTNGGTTRTDRGTSVTDDEDEENTDDEDEEIIEEIQPAATPAPNANANGQDGDSALNEEDIDDNQTPLGRLVQQIRDAVEQLTGGSPAATAALIAGVAIVLAALIFLLFLLLRRRRDKDENKNKNNGGKHDNNA